MRKMKNFINNCSGTVLLWTMVMMSLLVILMTTVTVVIISEMRQASQIDLSTQAYMAAETGKERAMAYIAIPQTTGGLKMNQHNNEAGDSTYDFEVYDSSDPRCTGSQWCFRSQGNAGDISRALEGRFNLVNANNWSAPNVSTWDADALHFPYPDNTPRYTSLYPFALYPFTHFGVQSGACDFTDFKATPAPAGGWTPGYCEMATYENLQTAAYNPAAPPHKVILSGDISLDRGPGMVDIRDEDNWPVYNWGLLDTTPSPNPPGTSVNQVSGRGLGIQLFNCLGSDAWCAAHGSGLWFQIFDEIFKPNVGGSDASSNGSNPIFGSASEAVIINDPSKNIHKLHFTLTYMRSAPDDPTGNGAGDTATLKIDDITNPANVRCLGTNTAWFPANLQKPYKFYIHNGIINRGDRFSIPAIYKDPSQAGYNWLDMGWLELEDVHKNETNHPNPSDPVPGASKLYMNNILLQAY